MITKTEKDIMVTVTPNGKTATLNCTSNDDVYFLHDYCVENEIPYYVEIIRKGLLKNRFGVSTEGNIVKLGSNEYMHIDFTAIAPVQPEIEAQDSEIEADEEFTEDEEETAEIASDEAVEDEAVEDEAEVEPESEQETEEEKPCYNVDGLISENEELAEKVAALEKENAELTAEVDKKTVELAEKDNEIAVLNVGNDNLMKEVEELKAKNENLSSAIDGYKDGAVIDIDSVVKFMQDNGIKTLGI